jgi:drug/metabolite transporter (DMT)-like permease
MALLGEGILIASRAAGTQAASPAGDILLLASVVFMSTSYMTGGRSLSKIGNWPTIAWSMYRSSNSCPHIGLATSFTKR